MNVEREVKFSASPTFALPDLDDLLGGVFAVARETQRLETVYFDTPDLRLARWGVSLRHRKGQGWTVKLPAEQEGDLLVRGEYAFLGDDPSHPAAEALDLLRAYVRTAKLQPTVRLHTVRRGVDLRDVRERLLAEAVDDEVSVLRGRQMVDRFREIEVEVTQDAPDGLLVAVVERLRAAGAGDPDPTPKYARALGAAAAQPPEVWAPPLVSGATAGDAVRRTIAISVERLLRHDALVRLDVDPEGVHRARVSTRRLRSDLRTFRSLLHPDWTTLLRDELRWLGGVLGEARDADVMLDRMRGRARSVSPTESPDVSQVLEVLAYRRKEAHATLLETVRTERYVELLDRLVTASHEPALLVRADLPAASILPGLMRKPWRRLRREVKGAGKEPSDEQIHAIRIRTKRARYAAEAAEPVAGRPARRFAEAAAALQDLLGEHHDAVVAEAWLRAWAGERRSRDAAFAAGLLAGMERAIAQGIRGRWRAAWKKLAKRRPARWS